MEHADLTTIFLEKAIPATVRMPKSIMRLLKKEARINGRSIGKQLTAILTERYTHASE